MLTCQLDGQRVYPAPVIRFVVVAALALAACGSGRGPVGHDAAVAHAPALAPPPTVAVAPTLARSDFTGSAACGACHDKKLLAWKHDWHARALAPAGPADMAGRF